MKFHHSLFDNGLEVVAELNDRALSVAAGFIVKAGSRDEEARVAGVSHFLEHMTFKGTDRRDAVTVNHDFDRVGAKHNAQTSEEDTFYHVTCLPEYLPQSFEVLADILRPTLRVDDFETEKQVIIEEIRMYLDNPMMVAYEAAKAAHFAPHPLGHSVLGTVESITDLALDRMRDYFHTKYGPSNIVLAVAGKTGWDEVVALAHQYCGTWTGGEAHRVASPPKGTGKFEAILRAEDRQQTVVALADGPPLESDDRYAASLLATILGEDYNQGGAFYTFLSCEPDEAQANLARIVDVFRAARADGIGADELEQARNKVLARSVIRSERPMGRLMSLGFHWTYRREYVPVDRELELYSAVTPDDLRRVLDRWPLDPLTVVSVGPTTDLHPIA
jgi:predicted Zn-dependent peptidase